MDRGGSSFSRPHLKRSFDQMIRNSMSRDNAGSQPEWAASLQSRVNASSSTQHDRRTPPTTPRFVGDGLDCRRPVISNTSIPANVIDLTVDSPPQTRRVPPPRSTDTPYDIIDVDDWPEDHDALRIHDRNDDDDIQFLRSVPLAQPAPPDPGLYQGMRHYVRNILNGGTNSNINDDPSRWGGRHGLQAFFSRNGGLGMPRMQAQNDLLPRASRTGLGRLIDNFVPAQDIRLPPVQLDFSTTELSIIGNPPTRSVYKAPPPPRPGFTRCPGSDDVLVCPSCDDELTIGDNDLKRQIWVVKECGHVYCGDCAATRNLRVPKSSKTDRSTSPTKRPLKACIVLDCGKKITIKGMVQVYLNGAE